MTTPIPNTHNEQPAPPTPYLLGPEEGTAWWFLGSLVTLKAGAADTHAGLTVAHFVNPPGFAPPLHRHTREDEMFYILSGRAEFRCAGTSLAAGPGDFVMLPRGLPHTFFVDREAPLESLQLTTPGGFEGFAAQVGVPALERRLPDPERDPLPPFDPQLLGHAAALHHLEILGPPE